MQPAKLDPWLERQLRRIASTNEPSAVDAAPEWGAAFIIRALAENGSKVVWLELTTDDDAVTLGDKLADALKRVMGRRLLEKGLGYRKGLTLLEQYADTLSPFTFAVSGAAYNPSFVTELNAVLNSVHKLVLAGEGSGKLLENADVIKLDTLALTKEEAAALAGDERLAGTPYERLLADENLLPSNLSSYRFVNDAESSEAADALIDSLLSRSAFTAALDVATSEHPQRTNDVLRRAGSHFAEQNLYQSVWDALNRLKPAQRKDALILFNLLDAANHVGAVRQLRDEVGRFLENYDAPDLRALYALLYLDTVECSTEVRKAYGMLSTSMTTFALGSDLAANDGERAEKLFRKSLRLAEVENNAFATIRAGWSLAGQLMHKGRYRESVYWTDWALRLYETQQLNSPRMKLLLINELAYVRILIGDIDGLGTLLTNLELKFANSNEVAERFVRTTLGDLNLASNNFELALTYYTTSSKGAPREALGDDIPKASRCMAELGKKREALEMAQQAYHLSEGTRSVGATALSVARLLLHSAPEKALPLAREAFEQAQTEAPLLAQAGACLARVQFALGDVAGAQASLEASANARAELSGVGLNFLECDSLPNLAPEQLSTERLELSFLGQQKVLLNNERIDLSLRQMELITLLVLYPAGLNASELRLHLFGDEEPRSLKAVLFRLRELVPLESKPYRLIGTVDADFKRIGKLLEEGDVTEAVSLYKGLLLAASEAPRIREERELLQEQIIWAAVTSRDPDILYILCNVEVERLDLWESLLEILPLADPRYPATAARYASIRKNWGLHPE